jgi:serralysin
MTAVADLSPAQQAALYAQVGEAMNNPGFNYDAHVSANTVNGVFVAPTNTPPATTPSNGSSSATNTNTATSPAASSSISGLSPAELKSLYSQVGDAMYAPGFSYSAHIAGNTVNGVFAAPVYIPADTSTLLAIPATGSADYQALLVQTGGAAANPGFNYAAHIAANVSQTRFDLSYDDVLRLIKETGRSDVSNIDLAAYRASTGSKVGLGNDYLNPVAAKVATNQIANSDILKRPAVGSPEYLALSLSTGGASEQASFNYAAHVAAITSQTVLKSLSYSEVMTLIAETGRSDFNNFDVASYQKEKASAAVLVGRLVADPTKNAAPAPTPGTPQYQQLLIETGLTDLSTFDYAAYVTAKHEANLALATLHGSANDDVIVANPTDQKDIFVLGQGNDTLTASNNADLLIGGEGNDVMDGGSGVDKAIYNGAAKDYQVTRTPDGKVVVADAVLRRDGTDAITGVERISFADTSLAFDINGNAGSSYRLYKAAFDRVPDLEGLGYWMHNLDQGANLANDVANGFLNSKEFQDLYGANTTTATFIDNLYKNVLHRKPDAEGYAYWESTLSAGVSRASILTNFSDSNENIDQVASLVGNGIAYIEYV